MKKKAFIVVGLGFGDEGKGSITDSLVKRENATLVVRFNGGAQAGHNVVLPDGRHHCFTQWGAGSFRPNCRTYLSAETILDPLAMEVEGTHLNASGLSLPFQRLVVDADALVITPYHRAANRIVEIVRGKYAHGSVGVGIGETKKDAVDKQKDVITWNDLHDPDRLQAKLASIRIRKLAVLESHCTNTVVTDLRLEDEFKVFRDPHVFDKICESFFRIAKSVETVSGWTQRQKLFDQHESIIFEGAQGVLLDEDFGFHPHTTWTRCTSHAARALLSEHWPEVTPTILGVLRAFTTRHGAGPLPTEDQGLSQLAKIVEGEHNRKHEFQGSFRYGYFDSLLARYALNVDKHIDALAVTCLDRYQSAEIPWKIAVRYRLPWGLAMDHIPIVLPKYLEEREWGTQLLKFVRPEYLEYGSVGDNPSENFLARIEETCRVPIACASYGPTAEDKRWNSLILDRFLDRGRFST